MRIRAFLIFATALLICSAGLFSQAVLTTNNNKVSYRARINPSRGDRFYFHAQRVDISNTRSIGVGFCIHYTEVESNSQRNSTFYVPNADKTQKWEFNINSDIIVNAVEAMNLTDEGHHWKVWIEQVPASSSASETKAQADTSVDYSKYKKYLENVKAELLSAGDEGLNSPWASGDMRMIHGNSIKRLSGSDRPGQITNISYKSMEQAILDFKAEVLKNRLSREDVQSRMDFYREYAEGGIIRLYVKRKQPESANPENYTIILADTGGKEIYRKRLTARDPRKNPSPDLFGAGYYSVNLYWVPNSFTTREAKIVRRDGRWIQEYQDGEDIFHITVIDEISRDEHRFEVVISADTA